MAIFFFFLLLVIELLYFKIANRFNIIDQPNHRSSHSRITIRGGGIIFLVSVLLFFVSYDFQFRWFVLGLTIISIISFLDDVLTLKNTIRLSIHLLAVALLFLQWELYTYPWYVLAIILVFVIATINAYNFMDGINGILGSYSLLTIITLYYINRTVVLFTPNEFLITVGSALVVFNFFNFRKKAKCFAGDVGSVSMALILIFLIGQLIMKTNNFNYILLLLMFGLDTTSTIIFRLIRKENIFEAHRSHFYQFLANDKLLPHLSVSLIYFAAQTVVNLIILFFLTDSFHSGIYFLLISIVLFIAIRFFLEGRMRLLKN